MARLDPHSYADSEQPRPRHLRLRLDVSFARRCLEGEADLVFDGPVEGTLDLDTRELELLAARTQAGAEVAFELGAEDAVLGRRLRLTLPRGTRELRLALPDVARRARAAVARARADRAAASTRSCSASARRSTPAASRRCQDTPRLRVTYEAELVVPEPLAAVMSAGPAGSTAGPRQLTRLSASGCRSRSRPTCWRSRSGGSSRASCRRARRCGPSRRRVDAAALRVRRHRGDDRASRGALRPVRLGPLRHARAAAVVPVRRHGEPAHDVPHADAARGRPLAGRRRRARARPLLDRQPRHERGHGALLAQRGLHRLGRAPDPRGAARRGCDRARLGDRREGARGVALALRRGLAADAPAHRASRDATRTTRSRRSRTRRARASSRCSSAAAGRPRFDRFMRAYMERFRFTSITTEEFLSFLERAAAGSRRARSARTRGCTSRGCRRTRPVFRSARKDSLVALAASLRARRRGPPPAEIAGWDPAETLVYLQNLPRVASSAPTASGSTGRSR